MKLTEELDGFVENVEMIVGEAVLQQLFRQQMTHGDVKLLVVSVSWYLNHFHTVEQRRGNGRQRVGSGYKQNL